MRAVACVLSLAFGALLSACSEEKVVTVLVRSGGYEVVGGPKSVLATSVVDEVVRRGADVVYLDVCMPSSEDPNAKYYGARIGQLRRELGPRFDGKITGNLNIEKKCAE